MIFYHTCEAVPKFLIFKLRRDHRKISYESVDDGTLSYELCRKAMEKRIS